MRRNTHRHHRHDNTWYIDACYFHRHPSGLQAEVQRISTSAADQTPEVHHLNLTSLQVVAQPASGAKATISNTGVLSVD